MLEVDLRTTSELTIPQTGDPESRNASRSELIEMHEDRGNVPLLHGSLTKWTAGKSCCAAAISGAELTETTWNP